ncbi:hypothetical protein [Paraburkholderia sacchari]|uniref:Uncharacterized protein n=1 Tax=Paraburkholderia sacchari TaxID=159450 RepID=A0A8T6ZHL4_9BURK|nr:hypothetical protein [Paraburkholderia sacchari]NLP63099.1 hypothetical protein [Paraburkholderia sacchari]
MTALYRIAQVAPRAIMPTGYVSVANRLEPGELFSLPFDNPLLTQRPACRSRRLPGEL